VVRGGWRMVWQQQKTIKHMKLKCENMCAAVGECCLILEVWWGIRYPFEYWIFSV
jgi:hypothetical protein